MRQRERSCNLKSNPVSKITTIETERPIKINNWMRSKRALNQMKILLANTLELILSFILETYSLIIYVYLLKDLMMCKPLQTSDKRLKTYPEFTPTSLLISLLPDLNY